MWGAEFFEILDEIAHHIARAALTLFFYVTKDILYKAAKGGNGVLQWPEVTQGICLLILCYYSVELVYNNLEPNGPFLAALLAGSGIGTAGAIFKKDNHEKPPSPPKSTVPAG